MGTNKRKFTFDQVREALKKHEGIRSSAASELGISSRCMAEYVRRMEAAGVEVPASSYNAPKPVDRPFQIAPLPADDLPIDELVAHRKRQFQKRRAYEQASKLIPVKVKIDGPVAIWHAGDPHVDDDGTDIEALERHATLCRKTPGMFAANVGDTTNGWVGRLARLYADQSTSAAQAWRLAEWWIGQCDWLYMIAGNHDLWAGAGDPLKWIARQQDALYKSSECRMELQFPSGLRVRVNARHDHAGSSIWNPAHGPLKAAHLGTRDHIYVAGHKHESAYGLLKDPTTGITMHAIKVASYKVYDRFAREKGFRDQALSPCCVTVINTRLPETHPDLVKVFWEPEEGADYLTSLRRRK